MTVEVDGLSDDDVVVDDDGTVEERALLVDDVDILLLLLPVVALLEVEIDAVRLAIDPPPVPLLVVVFDFVAVVDVSSSLVVDEVVPSWVVVLGCARESFLDDDDDDDSPDCSVVVGIDVVVLAVIIPTVDIVDTCRCPRRNDDDGVKGDWLLSPIACPLSSVPAEMMRNNEKHHTTLMVIIIILLLTTVGL